MIYCVYGLPSARTQWLLHLVAQLAEVVHGSVHIIPCVHLDDMRSAWNARLGRATVVFSDIPEAKLTQIFNAARAPIAIAYDPPRVALNFAMSARNLDLRQGLRFLTQSYATLEGAFLMPGAFVAGPRQENMRLRDFVRNLAYAYRQEIDETCVGAVVARMVGAGQEDSLETVGENVRRHIPPPVVNSGLDRSEEALAGALLDQYAVITTGRTLQAMNCPIDLLHDWDRMGFFLSAGAPIELLGPARILTAGHILHLPVGLWRVAIDLAVAGNLSGNGLSTDLLLGDESLGGVSARLPAEGRFMFEFDFQVLDGFAPIQLRMVLQEGAIEGEVTLTDVAFLRLPDDGALA